MLLGLKGQGHWVNESILLTRTAIHQHSLGYVASHLREIKLYECILVLVCGSVSYQCDTAPYVCVRVYRMCSTTRWYMTLNRNR